MAETPTPADTISSIKNRKAGITYVTEADTTLRDFYYYNRNADAGLANSRSYESILVTNDTENSKTWSNKNFYELTFSNNGGLVMPIIIQWTYKDGTKEIERIPVTIWRLNEQQVSKVFVKDKEVASIQLDPYTETADVNTENGMWPLKEMPSRFQLFKQGQVTGRGQSNGGNAMQNVKK